METKIADNENSKSVQKRKAIQRAARAAAPTGPELAEKFQTQVQPALDRHDSIVKGNAAMAYNLASAAVRRGLIDHMGLAEYEIGQGWVINFHDNSKIVPAGTLKAIVDRMNTPVVQRGPGGKVVKSRRERSTEG